VAFAEGFIVRHPLLRDDLLPHGARA
jgi:hypothetical protein